MTKLVVLADLHCHAWQDFASFGEDGVNRRLLDTIEPLKAARRICRERGIEHLALAGDIFHRRGVVNTLPFNLVVDELAKLRADGVRVFAMAGNHDMADRGGEVHVVEALRRSGLVVGVSTVKGHALWHAGDVPIHAFPYCDDRDEFSRRIDANAKLTRERGLALFHHGFKGARVGTHLEYEVREPISAKKRIGDRFPMTLSGHYHARQPIRGIDNGWYVGSPMEFVRGGAEKEEKGVMIVDLSSWTFEVERLSLPRFLSYEAEEWLQLGEEGGERVRGHFVDMTVGAGDEEHVGKLLAEAGVRGWRAIRPAVDRREREAIVDLRRPPRDVLASWLEVKKDELDGLGLSFMEVLEKGAAVLQKVSEES